MNLGKWLNQCIGKRNYPYFLLSVVTACLVCIAVAVLSSVEVTLLFMCNRDSPCIQPSLLGRPISSTIFKIFSFVFLFLGAIGGGLLAHLCAFHAFINYHNLTTYEYIRLQRDREASAVSSQQSSFLVAANNNKSTGWWSRWPCFACYRRRKRSQRPPPSVSTISKDEPPQNPEPSSSVLPTLLLQNALSNIAYLHPALPPDISPGDIIQNLTSRRQSNKSWKPPRVPRITRTSPSLEASSDWWSLGKNNRERSTSANHLLPPV